MDLSWKDGRKRFPKKSSMIGERYQVSVIPSAGCYERKMSEDNSQYYELLWSPTAAKAKGVVLEHGKDGVSTLPSNVREAALVKLARLDYNINLLSNANLKPSDGSDWSQEQQNKFRANIFRFRRNIRSVAKSLDIPLGECHAYYLGKYKCTPEYLLLKTICIDERSEKTDDYQQNFDVCVICGDGGNLIICDGCEGEYHMNCLQPQLRSVPAGFWLCDECVDLKALEARDKLLKKSKFFDMVSFDEVNNKKRSLTELNTDEKYRTPPASLTSSGISNKITSSEEFIDIISKFSLKIKDLLDS